MPLQLLTRPVRLGTMAILAAAAWCLPCDRLPAGEAKLKNGLVIEGTPLWVEGLSGPSKRRLQGPAANHPVLMIDNGVQRIFVPRRQVAPDGVNPAEDLGRFETFKIPQRREIHQLQLQTVGRVLELTPFDKFGRRTVTLATQFGPKPVVQGITRVTPKSLEIIGLNEERKLGLATASVPAAELEAILKNIVDAKNPDDRMSVARFYLQAGMFQQSAAELESIARDFPELKGRVKEIRDKLGDLQDKQLLGELRLRKDVGQHALAFQAARAFPTAHRSEAVLQEIRELIADYERAHERGESALFLLGQLQAKLDKPERIAEVAPLRGVISDQLNYDTLGRLDAFMKLAEDNSLSAAEKLGLAYSGWVLGSADATTDLDAALRLWKARFLVTDYLRENDPAQRTKTLAELKGVEGVGPEQVARLVAQLRPPLESTDIRPGEPQKVELQAGDVEMPVSYSVLLPPEYNPDRAYPLLVTLHPAEIGADAQVRWWGMTRSNTTGTDIPGQSQRYGYIVIAPEYAQPKQQTYNYDAPSHYVVLESIRDARKRFHIDSDRVFLSGHGMGADAAFDIGMSHPEVFAGVVPIAGMIGKYCTWYWQNAEHVAWYVVGGELDRNTLEQNSRELTRMMQKNFDVMYVEHIGRGYESYYSEILRIFEWMNLHRRVKYPKSIAAKVLRSTDDRFYWLQASGFPASVTQVDLISGHGDERVLPMPIEAEVTAANALHITSGAAHHTVWLAPAFVDFEKRLLVRVKAQPKFNDFVRPDVETMLEDLRTRGDRETLYWARLDFN